MKLLVFLGNYPKEYSLTRHNIGFIVGDAIQEKYDFSNWNENKKLLCNISKGVLFDKDCILIKPNTYMNCSGDSVIKVLNFYKIKPNDVVVIHDELDFDFGTIKTTNSRNSAGHNGVKSVNSVIHEPYNRIRIGIGRPEEKNFDVSNYVLSKFSAEEQSKFDNIIEQSILTIKTLF